MAEKLFKIVTLVVGLFGGVIAGALFKQVWKRTAGEEEAPSPTDEDTTWKEMLPAAALQGALAGVVRACLSRGGASAVRKLTGTWPA
ncbi:DUF4235 domain-containing protein [Streptomyces sp. NPDC059740]|uniref:DUF4235 domain-containing protein n=1 Tax=Streptomyces sp. NPDC059740 TaxID=3346926 RepID=UPI003654A405